MSLDVYLTEVRPTEVYWANITHNLGRMADEAGIYQALWRPEEIDCVRAIDLIPLLQDGLYRLAADPEHFQQFNPINGWGSYDSLLTFTRSYLAACQTHPEATISVSR